MSFLKKNKKRGKNLGLKGKGKVILTKQIYRNIIASCARFANTRIPEPEWLEIYGILIGRNIGDDVLITEAHAITHTQKKGHILKVSYDSPDYIDAVLIEEAAIVRDPPEFQVGWYHSHPGIKVMFSSDDIRNQLGFQTNNPLAIGIVFNQRRLLRQVESAERKGDPSIPLNNDTGFKIFRLEKVADGQAASYVEIPFEFSDSKITPALIEEAKTFTGNIGKLLPTKDVLGTNKLYIDKNFAKLQEIYAGTESYIKTLISKGDTSRIAQVHETQKEELDKIINNMENDIKLLEEIVHYVEYKERGETINTVLQLIKDWKINVKELVSRFNQLKAI